jgi:hypothetical protein
MDSHCVLTAVTAIVVVTAASAVTRAESLSTRPDDYCSRVWELARSRAALLYGPRIGVQALRYPPTGGSDSTGFEAAQRQVQVRSFLDYSLTHAIEGKYTLDLANAECRRRQKAQPVEEAIRVATEQGRRAALGKEIAFLTEQAPEIARFEREAEKRLEQQVSTLSELAEIRLLALSLKQLQLDAEDALAQIEAVPATDPSGPVSKAAVDYDQATLDAEQIDSRIRQVAPWNLSIRGGVAATPASSSVDWFGAVELSYNLGGIVSNAAEHRYLAARSRELESSSSELVPAARALDRTLAGSVQRLKKESLILEELAEQLRKDAAALEGANTPKQPHSRAVLSLRRLAVEARLVYLRELTVQRRPWNGQHEH